MTPELPDGAAPAPTGEVTALGRAEGEAATPSAAVQVCHRSRCQSQIATKQLTLLKPDGRRSRTTGPYCDEHLDDLARTLIPTYSFTGAPCFVVEPFGDGA